ncbi:MAG: 4Fe-4S binding protein, partial [Polyangiaceae bacterium]|nr:4Fe-4S binding protein [Polyangiaceae bacterium]
MTEALPRPIPWLESTLQTKVDGKGRRHLPMMQVAAGNQAVQTPSQGAVRALQKTKAQSAASSSRQTGWRSFLPRKKKRPGSGIPARRVIRFLRHARIVSQAFFLLLFLYLLTQTTFRGGFTADPEQAIRLSEPVEGFLLFDPFVAALTFLSTHQVYAGLTWSLVIVALTLFVGRAFCGWICPFGTIHHLVSWLSPSRYLKGSRRVKSNQTKGWQNAKYYGVASLLAAALAGSAFGGIFDPICVVVRGFGLGVLPAVQYVGTRFFDWLAATNLQFFQGFADQGHHFLGRWVFTPSQSYYHETWLVLSLFLGVIALNRAIPRFWCRALCPLGAFLGFMSRFAIFGMEKDHSKCTDCNLCLVDCQGGDS